MAFVDNAYNGRVIVQGIMPVKITITAACDVGDLIGYDAITSSLWELADADGKIPAQLVAGEQNYSTAATEITCFKMAEIDFGSGCTATPGDMVYLSNTAGSYAATPGTWVHQCVGQAMTAQRAFIQPDSSPICSYSTTGTGNGGFIRCEVPSGKTSLNPLCGLRVDLKTIATSVIGGDVYGIYVMYQMQQTQTASSAIMRLCDESDSADVPDAFMMFSCASGGGPDYFLAMMNSQATGWNGTGGVTPTCSGVGGWLKCYFSGVGTRYIQLWTTVA